MYYKANKHIIYIISYIYIYIYTYCLQELGSLSGTSHAVAAGAVFCVWSVLAFDSQGQCMPIGHRKSERTWLAPKQNKSRGEKKNRFDSLNHKESGLATVSRMRCAALEIGVGSSATWSAPLSFHWLWLSSSLLVNCLWTYLTELEPRDEEEE